jgi:hypothetical protein
MEYYNKLLTLRKQKYDKFLELKKIYDENNGELPIELQGEGEKLITDIYWLDCCLAEYKGIRK